VKIFTLDTGLCSISLLQELGFKFTWNNLLHTQVEQSIAAVLHEECTEEEEDEHKENPLLSQVSIIWFLHPILFNYVYHVFIMEHLFMSTEIFAHNSHEV